LRTVLAGLAAMAVIAAGIYFVGDQQGWFGRAGEQNLADATPDGGATENETTQVAAAVTTEPPVETVQPNDGTIYQEVGQDATSTDTTTVATAQSESPPVLDSPPQPLTPNMSTDATASSTASQDAAAQPLPTPPQDNNPPQGADQQASVDIGPALTSEAAAANAGNTAPNATDVSRDADVSAAAAIPDDAGTNVPSPSETPAAADIGAYDAAAGSAAPTDVVPPSAIEPGTEAITTEATPTGPLELGTYLGGKTVLLRYDDQAGGWFRVQPRSAVVAGDRLLALPEFRPKITLASGLHMDMSGGTQVVTQSAGQLPADGLATPAADMPAMEVMYGRVILINTSNAPNQVRVAAGSSVGDARLARNATLAIEVERQYVPGNDPRQSPAPVIARFYVPDGGVEWQDASGSKTIDNASRWTVEPSGATDVVADASPPDWIDQEPAGQRSEQRYGAPVIESTMVSDKPADIQLLELFQGNARKEVKSLAAKSSVHVGLFEPFIDALRDSEQKANWAAHIATLRAAMALSPDSAANVKRALDEQRGSPAADELYEMLCGYNADQIGRTPEEIRSGALSRLIDRLENDSLDYRVLAVNDLWETTGKRLMPDPAANLKERTQNIRRWRSRLEAGELLPGQPLD
jgi:hypothetical protein